MCGTAAHLTDRVFPDVPVRQWVLSVPFELRLLLARNHRALSAVGRIFVCEVLRAQRQRATALLIANSRGAAICFPQRFGGSLNLNVHYHVAVADGVFTLEPGAPRAGFHALPAPDTRLRFKQLPEHDIPTGEAVWGGRIDVGTPVDRNLVASVVARWRGIAMSNKPTAPTEPTGLDSLLLKPTSGAK
jgi:hypothetical protein